MKQATEIIKLIAQETDSAILFHSASGKDSIALLDLMAPHFRRIVCVYMYLVKNLRHINRYISYARAKYPNAEFVQVPHYALGSMIKTGYMGCAKNPKQTMYTMSDLTELVRKKTGVEWAFFGFKQSDGMNRRIMLTRSKPPYEMDAICRKTKKCYPLSAYKNSDVVEYISRNGLIKPEIYGKTHQSNGANITDLNYLLWLRSNSPDDLQTILSTFPCVAHILFEYDSKQIVEK